MEADFIAAFVFPAILALLMLGMGMTLSPADFKRVAVFPKAALTGLLCQLLLLPLLGWGVAQVLQLSPVIAVGIMVIASCPGGATSNLITYFARGDVALSITLTALSSAITVFTIPLVVNFALWYFTGKGQQIQLPILKTMMQIILLTALPVSIGMAVNSFFPRFARWFERPMSWISALFILLAIVLIVVVIQQRGSVTTFFVQAGTPVLLLNLLSLLAGFGVAKLAKLPIEQVVTISIETGIQNGTLGITIASSPFLLNRPEMAVPAAVYGITMCITGVASIGIFRRVLSKEQGNF
ncbi:MAG: bile acid:sodium symporter family protein [Cytophagales bacterium]|nr:bile acid:sodium symporter family protein [Bernardetiaceae bacterium]MDW8209521.1 bile acid:sodium symporter family protein [Cytophagales bacterium]